jgi:uncharacterized repeat protein (TIGR03803 family)
VFGGTCNSDIGFGTVFKLVPDGTETVLYAFQGTTDGANPYGNLISDPNGNLFGTTGAGGDMNVAECSDFGYAGCGTAFEVTPSGNETVIYEFQGGSDGWSPEGGLISDSSGNYYGTTTFGGSANCDVGCGIVFKIAPGGTEAILYTFQGGTDGYKPAAALTTDNSGNFYGTTVFGGSDDDGTVYKLSPDGSKSVLYSFKGGNDGANPEAGVIMDRVGNLYGTTDGGGGDTACRAYGGCGTIFKLAPDGKETVLSTFDPPRHGRTPMAPLLMGKKGLLYGTATQGGAGNGVVFKVKK